MLSHRHRLLQLAESGLYRDEIVSALAAGAEALRLLSYRMLLLAESVARRAHEGQREPVTGAPYITHVVRVVDQMSSADAKAVAWLHDVVEDTAWTPVHLVDHGFPDHVVVAVVRLTRLRSMEYSAYIDRLLQTGDALAIEVKLADLRDHLRPNCPARLRPRYEEALARLSQWWATHQAAAGARQERL